MSPTGTSCHSSARNRAGTARRRAITALIAAGALAAVPVAVHAAGAPSAVVAKGAPFAAGNQTPAVVRTALKGNGPVVIAFLLPGITEDEIVLKRLNTLQRQGKFRDTKFIVYRITGKTKLGDLPDKLDLKYTPAVAVIQGDDKLSNVWRGLVDEDIIAQSLIDARAAVPHPVSVPEPKGVASGDPAGVALAKRVNARYADVPGMSAQLTAGANKMTMLVRLVDGKTRVFGVKGTAGGNATESVLNAYGAYSKLSGASCWTRRIGAKSMEDLYKPVIAVQGVRFQKPVKSKNGPTLTLRGVGTAGQFGAGVNEYTINATTFDLVGQTSGAVTARFSNLDAAPTIPKPEPVC